MVQQGGQGGYHLGAINNLGVLYYNGLGVARDYTEAARWFDRAAARGAAEAQFQLGLMYWLGQGVPADEAVAVRLMRTAANQGFPIAMINMGDIYRDGNGGTPIDLVRAYGWYMMGLERAKGDPHLEAIAERSLEALQSTLSTAQINAAKTWADEWAPGTN